MSRVLDAILTHAVARPEAIALSDATASLTYAELATEVERTVDALVGVGSLRRPDLPVAVQLENSLAWVLVDLALIRLGWPSVPIPNFFSAHQLRHVLEDFGADLLVQACDGPPHLIVAGTPLQIAPLGSPSRRHGPSTAKITYTSGSTGAPKGVCLSQAQMESVAASLVSVIGADYAGTHLPLLSMTILLENVAGLYTTFLAGGRYHIEAPAALGLQDPFKPDLGRLVDSVAHTRASSLILVPELLRAITVSLGFTGRRLPDLNLVAVGGAKVARQLLDQAEAVGLPVYEGYGLSECASVVALNTPADRRAGSVGRPLPHLQVRVDAGGEIVVGPRPFLGYVGDRPSLGPVHTGDIGHLDAEGFLHIDGRRSNTLITSHGRNIAPEWVESELLAQPLIRQALVFGEAQAELGALIVPLSLGVDAAAIGQAVERANENLPAYAQVRRWLIRPPFDPAHDELTGNGRPRRAVLLSHHRDFIEARRQEAPLTFFPELVAKTAQGQKTLAEVPQIQDGLAGRISRETYVAYLTEAYHHVKHTVPLMQAAKARLDDRHARFRDALDEYIAEETGHEEWILNDIRNAGGDAEQVRSGDPRPATQEMVDFVYGYIANGNPMGFFGMVLVLEGTSVRLATQGAAAVAASLSLGSECFTYLSSHGAVDQSHLVFFQGLMDEIEDPDDQAAIVEVANAVFDRFAEVFRAIPHDRSLAHVA